MLQGGRSAGTTCSFFGSLLAVRGPQIIIFPFCTVEPLLSLSGKESSEVNLPSVQLPAQDLSSEDLQTSPPGEEAILSLFFLLGHLRPPQTPPPVSLSGSELRLSHSPPPYHCQSLSHLSLCFCGSVLFFIFSFIV